MWFRVFLFLLLSSSAWAGLPPTRILDEGTDKGVAFKFDCVGAGIVCSQSGVTGTLTVGTGSGGDSISIDGVAVTDPNFNSTGDVDFVDTANVVTGTVVSVRPAAENSIEALLDLQDLQGTVTDGQVPNTITIDNSATATALAADPADCGANTFATTIAASGALTCASIGDADVPNTITIDLATLATTATTANAGDSATSFFSSGTLEETLLPDSATVTGWVMGASTATTPAVDDSDTSLATTAFVNAEINDDLDASAELIALVDDETGTGALVFGTSPTIATPIETGKTDRNNVAVDDDDCTGEQGLYWYDTTDSRFEFCDANSGVPTAISAATDTNAVKEYWWPASASLPLEVADSIPPISKDAGTNIDQLTIDFNDSTDECRTVNFKVPSDVTGGSTVTFRWHWYSAAQTSGNAILEIRHNGGQAEGADPDQALTVVAAAADATQGTAGQRTFTVWTETLANLGWAANEEVDAEFCRDANNVSDTLTDDLKTTGFGVEIPRE